MKRRGFFGALGALVALPAIPESKTGRVPFVSSEGIATEGDLTFGSVVPPDLELLQPFMVDA